MQEVVTRQQVEKLIVDNINIIRHDKKKVKLLENEMKRYNLTSGMVQKYLINIESEIEDMDLRLIVIFISQLYKLTEDHKLNPDLYFTEIERKQAKIYTVEPEYFEPLEFPIIFNNVLRIDDENYITIIDIPFTDILLKSKILRYNFDTQREGKFIRRHDTIEKVPDINSSSVNEITDRLLGQSELGTLSPTTLTFNALLGSADNGDELIYDSKKMQLMVTKGTFLDILDGMHRILGSVNALEINPSLNFKFQLAIKNYSTSQAQKHLAEISKINEINKTYIKSLEQSRYSDIVVNQLMRESDLKGRISKSDRIRTINNELCSYSVLADTIDEIFEMKSNKDAMDVGLYLTNFFNYLIGSFPNEFIENVSDTKKTSLINANILFVGYIVLAKRMKEENIEISNIVNILKQINFSRSNPMWEELNILENEKIGNRPRKHVKEYFRNISLY